MHAGARVRSGRVLRQVRLEVDAAGIEGCLEQDSIRPKRRPEVAGGIDRQLRLFEDVEVLRPIGATEILADYRAPGIGNDLCRFSSAADAERPVDGAAPRPGEDVELPLDLHPADLRGILQSGSAERRLDQLCRDRELDFVEIEQIGVEILIDQIQLNRLRPRYGLPLKEALL